MKEGYLEANLTRGVGSQTSSFTETITHIIRSNEEFDIAFNEFPKDVDFSKNMLIVHFFTSSYSTSPYKLEKAKFDGDTLQIEYKLNKSGSIGVPDAGIPQQTCIVVLIDKLMHRENILV